MFIELRSEFHKSCLYVASALKEKYVGDVDDSVCCFTFDIPPSMVVCQQGQNIYIQAKLKHCVVTGSTSNRECYLLQC